MTVRSEIVANVGGFQAAPEDYDNGIRADIGAEVGMFVEGVDANAPDLVGYFDVEIAAGGTYRWDLLTPLAELGDNRAADTVIFIDIEATDGALELAPSSTGPWTSWLQSGTTVELPAGAGTGIRDAGGTGNLSVTSGNSALDITNPGGTAVLARLYVLAVAS